VTRVLIADDDDLMRAGLAELLTADPEIDIIGQASTGRQAIERTRQLTPDVVLMDVRMPDLDGIAATRELSRTAPGAKVLILTTFEQDGDALLSPSVTRRVIDRMAHQPAPDLTGHAKLDRLTPRERDVLELIARGLSNREIAAALVVEESTVRTHVKRILMKLDLRDRVQAVILAYETRLNQPAR
jgi:DNA-binding NarL/FixJ family response regulator